MELSFREGSPFQLGRNTILGLSYRVCPGASLVYLGDLAGLGKGEGGTLEERGTWAGHEERRQGRGEE